MDQAPRNFDQDDWWFRTSFARPADVTNTPLWLCFGGLATLCDVWLNGELLLHSDNMFRSHRCRIDALLQDHNELVIRCASLDSALTQRRPRPRWKAPMIANQQLRWWRTTVLGRTPGWSLPAAPVGPWQPVWLEQPRAVQLSVLKMATRLEHNTGHAAITLAIEAAGTTAVQQAEIHFQHGTDLHVMTLQIAADTTTLSGELRIPDVKAWWPHTHGTPHRYALTLHLGLQDGTRITSSLGHTGFRQIQLDTTHGNFALTLNGTPVFCRGACWTPPDGVSLHSTTAQLRHSLTLLRDAGMNMVRVGGTMVYEREEFATLCDELGLMLWQECMFANMDFPETDEFIANVRAELNEQFTRLSGHPCVTVICGNSEAEQQAAMFGAGRELWSPRLFHEVIPAIVQELLPDVPYWPSSAHGGDFPHQNNQGTTSYYGTGAYLRPLTDARRSEVRFATECLAFANVPEDACIERMPGGLALKTHHPRWKERTPRDLGAGWDFEDVRDHYLEQLYGVHPLQLRYADHDRYLQLSRTTTGEVMSAAFSEWRRVASSCQGALIWFWQDLWPGASWGIVDATGVPKAAYYYLKRSLQPVAVNLTDEGTNGVAIHLHNETPQSRALQLEYAAYKAGSTRVAHATQSLSLAPHEQHALTALGLFEHFADHNHAYRFGSAMCDVIVATLRDAQQQVVAQGWLFPAGLNPARWPDPGLTATAQWPSADTAHLTLHAERFAQSVRIDCPGWTVEDQYFHLAPGQSRCIMLKRTMPDEDRPAEIRATLSGTLRISLTALNSSSPVHITANAPNK